MPSPPEQETEQRCPTCGATVEVVTGDEGTSRYRPVAEENLRDMLAEAGEVIDMARHALGDRDRPFLDDAISGLLAELQAAEARARNATEALDALWSDLGGMGQHHTSQAVTVKVLSALATTRGERG